MTASEASSTARLHSRLIVLNGTSSAGKTTLSEVLQVLLDESYLLMGYDRTWAVISPRSWPFQPQDREGIWYDLHPEDSSVATGIGIGSREPESLLRTVQFSGSRPVTSTRSG